MNNMIINKESIEKVINKHFNTLDHKVNKLNQNINPEWEDYIYTHSQEIRPKILDLSHSLVRKRYKGIVEPKIQILNIDDVLDRIDVNYTPEEYPEEQGYIDNRLIPHMKKNKLPLPTIEIYTQDLVDNHRPHLPSGKRPKTDIHIIDGAHRIVALKKLGIKKVPFIVYTEPKE